MSITNVILASHRNRGATGLLGELVTDEQVWPGFITLLQPDVGGAALHPRGVILAYDSPVAEERWFTYTADDSGKGVKQFRAIGDGSLLVLRADTTTSASTSWSNCDRNNANASTNHSNFRNGLAAHDYTDWSVTTGISDGTFVNAWNASATSERFLLKQGSYNESTGVASVSHAGFVLYRTNNTQYWLLFTAGGANGEVAFAYIGVNPSNQTDNSSTKGTLKFEARTANFTTTEVGNLPSHSIVKHSITSWP